MKEIEKFLLRYRFNPKMKGMVATERERFIVDQNGMPVPKSEILLKNSKNRMRTYEFSACQIEDRTLPKSDDTDILLALLKNENDGIETAHRLGFHLVPYEVAPEDMPLDVYPDPRYLAIRKTLTPEVVSAACRVGSVQILLGAENWETALQIYQNARQHLNELCKAGDHSNGLRMKLYRKMAPRSQPPDYRNVSDVFEDARSENFLLSHKNNWRILRFHPYGYVEFRMFGNTPYLDEIMYWIEMVKQLSREVT